MLPAISRAKLKIEKKTDNPGLNGVAALLKMRAPGKPVGRNLAHHRNSPRRAFQAREVALEELAHLSELYLDEPVSSNW